MQSSLVVFRKYHSLTWNALQDILLILSVWFMKSAELIKKFEHNGIWVYTQKTEEIWLWISPWFHKQAVKIQENQGNLKALQRQLFVLTELKTNLKSIPRNKFKSYVWWVIQYSAKFLNICWNEPCRKSKLFFETNLGGNIQLLNTHKVPKQSLHQTQNVTGFRPKIR